MKNNFTSKILLALLTIGGCATLSAQTVIKVGASQGAKQTTIQLAYDSIVPATLAEAYVIEIQSDYDPAAETYPINLKAKTGASEVNSITIKPATGVKKVIGPSNQSVIASGVTFALGATTLDLTGKITSGSISQISTASYISGMGTFTNGTFNKVTGVADNVVSVPTTAIIAASAASGNKLFFGPAQTQAFNFNGASYVTIDGVSRTDANTGLTIQNPNLIYAQVINFTNTAFYNTVKNCILRGAVQTGAWNNGFQGTVFFNGSHHNIITNNDVCDMNDPNIPMPICAFQMTGVGINYDNTISYNNIYNVCNESAPNGNSGFFQFGSTYATTSCNNNILNNRIYWTKPAVFSTNFFVIGIGGNMNGLANRIENNIIGWQADGTTSAELSTTTAALTFNGVSQKNCTFKNNILGGINFVGKAFVGFIFAVHNTPTAFNADDYCYGNQVKDITVTATATGASIMGMQVNVATPFAVNVKNNVVNNITLTGAPGYTCTVTGIDATGTPVGTSAITYTGNKTLNLTAGDALSTAANVAYGIKVNQGAVVVNGNMVSNIYCLNNTNTAIIRGIQTAGSNVNGQLFSNNIVRLGTYVTNDASIIGFYQGAATTAGDPMKLYNNTIYIGGQSPSTAIKPTYAYYKLVGNSQANDIQNNIFANKRVLGNTDVASAEAHYAMFIPTAANISKCNYNIYQFSKYMGNVDSFNATDLAGWVSNNNSDANSLVADPQFEAPEALVPDMRIKSTSPAKAAGTNLLALVPKDFNDFTRTANDTGALAYGTVSEVVSLKDSQSFAYGTNRAIVVNGMTGETANIYAVSGQLIKSVMLNSDKESITANKGFYIVKVASLSTKVLVK